jgi:c-di-GMP-binding flagellar brake protein YcgR
MSQPPGYIRQPWPKTRQSPRQPLEGRLTIHAPNGKLRGWLHDISEDGLGCVVSAKLATNSEVQVEFELKPEQPLRAGVVVRFGSGFRYGFQFATITPEQRNAIRRYCAEAPPKTPDRRH